MQPTFRTSHLRQGVDLSRGVTAAPNHYAMRQKIG
ncbi:hypothetical protein FOVG_16810 [Fusarium oxysporum f. sp. pisi HDV247]|uniref:Uncharacterized protein n=2 Tax=Fusarium oxysporum TaxID=5507 RepID=W9L6T6_FUSOX|nr:hypothetical protein FOZG_02244 [Fusarium oxysporum Fo47]EXA31932.1 hypothetical protein FOVG_16810 [Fusarium oxysporum f. sp. pisi HDV247]